MHAFGHDRPSLEPLVTISVDLFLSQAGGRAGEDLSRLPATPIRKNVHAVMNLLKSGVPITLVLDLLDPAGPDSAAILAGEPEPEFAWWSPRPRHQPEPDAASS
jgi:hypothetical protein